MSNSDSPKGMNNVVAKLVEFTARISIQIVVGVTGIMIYTFADNISEIFPFDWRVYPIFRSSGFFIALLAWTLLVTRIIKVYLDRPQPKVGSRERGEPPIQDYDLPRIAAEASATMAELKREVDRIHTLQFSAEDKQSALERTIAALESSLKNDALNIFEGRFAAPIVNEARLLKVRDSFRECRTRLLAEAGDLTRRGNINLGLGSGTTTVALFLLWLLSSQVQEKAGTADWLTLAYHVIPRLTLAIFIQAFAYFFLRLYKSTLEEIKYYQNEITNVDLWLAAVETSAKVEDSELAKQIATTLLGQDRNHSGKKLLPAVSENDSDSHAEILGLVKDLISKIK